MTLHDVSQMRHACIRYPKHSITTLALDLEGTLISNAVSQIPRPGLHDFLEFCRSRFSDLLIYSGVRERRFRKVAAQLIADEMAPRWFGDVRHQYWVGDYKDLRCIAGATLKTIAIVDDQEECVRPDQRQNWIPIQEYERPYSASDNELARVSKVLEELAAR